MNTFLNWISRCAIGFFVVLFTHASLSDVVIITPDENQYAYNIAVSLQSQLTDHAKITSEAGSVTPEDIIIALGSAAYHKVGDVKNTVITIFIPYEGDRSALQSTNNRYYIYSEPSPKQIHSFISKNFTSSTIGYLYTDKDKGVASELAEQFKLSENTFLALKGEEDVFSSIRELIRYDIDIMLLSKNSDLYTSKNIRTIIEALTRKRIPVIVTTKSLVKSGATISISSDQTEIVTMTAKIVNLLVDGSDGAEKISSHTKKVNIEINQSMISLYRFTIGTGEIK
jgi:ABC-type uncharacterized transport system substrate-binding protein